MTSIILPLLVISIMMIILYYFIELSRKVKRTNTKGLGFSSFYYSRSELFTHVVKFIQENNILKGLVHFWMGPKLCLLAVDPESAKFILKTPQFKKRAFGIGKKLSENFGKNLVTLDGEEWRHHRNIVNSGFNNKAYASYYSTFIETIEKAITIMTQDLTNDINCRPLFSKFTLDLLGKSIFHYNFGQLDNANDEYFNAYKRVLGYSFTSLGILLTLFPWLENIPFKSMRDYLRSIDLLISLFHSIIKEKQQGVNQGDVLDHLLDVTSGLSPVELISEIWIFFIAGHETTATALSWACMCLAEYPEIQEKLSREIISAVGTEKIPTIEELDKIQYLDCFINEVLRAHSPVPMLFTRNAVEDVVYENYFIPKGTMVGLCIDAIHKNPEFWPNPEKFDPDRFLPENKKGRNHFAFLPFSLGQRQCIGNNFSLIEQKLFLTRFLQKYRVLPPVDHQPHDITKFLRFASDQECYIRLEKRIN